WALQHVRKLALALLDRRHFVIEGVVPMVGTPRRARKTRYSRSWIQSVLSIALITWGFAHAASAEQPRAKMDPALRAALDNATPNSTVRVIIRAKTPNIAPVRAHVLNSGNSVAAEHQFIHSLTAKLRPRDVADFETDPTVDNLSLDHTVRSTGGPPRPHTPPAGHRSA